MSSVPLPLRHHVKHQEDLIWWATEAEGALGRKSIQGTIENRLNGGGSGHLDVDILEDSVLALADATHSARFKAATRLRRITRAWKLLSREDMTILYKAYWTSVQPGLDAFGRLGGLIELSKTARYKHEGTPTKMTYGEWVVRLSDRVVSKIHPVTKKSTIKGTRAEIELVKKINRELEAMLTNALENYVTATRRSRL